MTHTQAHRAGGRGFDTPGAAGTYTRVTAGCLLAAAVLAGTGHGPHGADAAASAAPLAAPAGLAMGCRTEALPEGGMQWVLVNTTADRLPSGTRVAWSSSGTPRPAGEVRVLPHALGPAESLALRSDEPHRGGGCLARVLPDERPSGLLGGRRP